MRGRDAQVSGQVHRALPSWASGCWWSVQSSSCILLGTRTLLVSLFLSGRLP